MKEKLVKLIKKARKGDGFTLIEMVLVLFIVAALLLLIIPNINTQADNAQEKTDDALIKTVETQKQLYLLENESSGSVTAEDLQSKGYISEDQLKKYNATNAAP